jgi:hypothetical protein
VAFRHDKLLDIIEQAKGFWPEGATVELSVLVQQTANNRFRAWCAQPVAAEAEGATRDEALANLKTDIEAKTRGVEVVRIVVGRPIPTAPIWPDDEITRAWLDGIAAARAAADQQPDPWDAP